MLPKECKGLRLLTSASGVRTLPLDAKVRWKKSVWNPGTACHACCWSRTPGCAAKAQVRSPTPSTSLPAVVPGRRSLRSVLNAMSRLGRGQGSCWGCVGLTGANNDLFCDCGNLPGFRQRAHFVSSSSALLFKCAQASCQRSGPASGRDPFTASSDPCLMEQNL